MNQLFMALLTMTFIYTQYSNGLRSTTTVIDTSTTFSTQRSFIQQGRFIHVNDSLQFPTQYDTMNVDSNNGLQFELPSSRRR